MQSLPVFLQAELAEQYGDELCKSITAGYASRKTTVRINTLKTDCAKAEQCFAANGIGFINVPWYGCAYIITAGEEKLRTLPEYENGELYLQSLSSMLPALALNAAENTDVLDMCAAPGSKTTQLACLTQNKAYITACESNKIRADRLKYNLQKQGATRVNVLITDSRRLDSLFSFDKILLDAPCSGSGTLNLSDNRPLAISQKLIENSARTQASLIKKAIEVLKPGGELVYSTCSVLKRENEDIISAALKNKQLELVPLNADASIPLLPVAIDGTVCVQPTGLYEGFFMAKLKKRK